MEKLNMGKERIEQYIEEKLNYLETTILEAEKIIPTFREGINKELEDVCFEITEVLENHISSIKLNYGRHIQINPLERAKGVKNVLKRYVLFNDDAKNNLIKKKTEKKKSKLFISHSTEDAKYVEQLVELCQYLGFNKETLFCSSYSGFGIPLNGYIYDYLKKQFEEYELYVIFILSENYYTSPACLNEMGAAWVLGTKHSAILLPGFEFKEIKGAINPNRVSIKMDQKDLYDLKYKLGELKNNWLNEFNLSDVNADQWERKRDKFIEEINSLAETVSKSV